jgi:predicted nucleic acid-binding protein
VAQVARYLADTSALARLRHKAVAQRLVPLIKSGLVAPCGAIEIEIRRTARVADEYDVAARTRTAAYEWLSSNDAEWLRALDVQQELAFRGHHRGVRVPDLLIAATAERHGVTVLHYDRDFDLMAEVSDQRTEWIVPAGSVP